MVDVDNLAATPVTRGAGGVPTSGWNGNVNAAAAVPEAALWEEVPDELGETDTVAVEVRVVARDDLLVDGRARVRIPWRVSRIR